MDYEAVAKALKEKLEGDVTTESKPLAAYETDASIFKVKPALAVYPKGAEDIQKLVAYVADHKEFMPGLSITARAAGTCMSGGSLTESITMDVTRYMSHIGEITDRTIEVEPGAYYRDMEAKTLEHNLILPSYTASKNLCTIGGMIANNSSGERTLTYGDTSKYLESLNVVLADGNSYTFKALAQHELEEKMGLDTFEGEIYRKVVDLVAQNYDLIRAKRPRVSKNSSGYLLWNMWNKDKFNLAQLICGSQGTLGLFTKGTLSLVEQKKYKTLLVMELRTLAPLPAVINTVLAYKPECFESFDEHTFALAETYMPESAAKVVTDKATVITLIAEFCSNNRAFAEQIAADAKEALEDRGIEAHIINSEEDQSHYWKIRRSSFALLKSHSGEKERTAPFIDDIIVRPEDLPSFLPRLQAILADYKMTYTLAGHVGNGNFHLIPLVDMEAADAADKIIELARRVFALVFEYGGSMAGEHNDGIIRTPFVKDMFGPEMYELFVKTKNIFDPKNIFNPGKKVGGTMEYAKAHIVKTNTNEHL
jgi:FAD/FMN-containing dehydrogenase